MKRNTFILTMLISLCILQKACALADSLNLHASTQINFKTSDIVDIVHKFSPLITQGGIIAAGTGLCGTSLYVWGKLAKTRFEQDNRAKVAHDSALALGASLGFAAGLGLIYFSSKLAAHSL